MRARSGTSLARAEGAICRSIPHRYATRHDAARSFAECAPPSGSDILAALGSRPASRAQPARMIAPFLRTQSLIQTPDLFSLCFASPSAHFIRHSLHCTPDSLATHTERHSRSSVESCRPGSASIARRSMSASRIAAQDAMSRDGLMQPFYPMLPRVHLQLMHPPLSQRRQGAKPHLLTMYARLRQLRLPLSSIWSRRGVCWRTVLISVTSLCPISSLHLLYVIGSVCRVNGSHCS